MERPRLRESREAVVSRYRPLHDECSVEPGLTYVGSFSMAEHRYTVGDLVRVQGSVAVGLQSVQGTLDQLSSRRLKGIYEITRLLPGPDNGTPQYQVRSCDDQVHGDQASYVVLESQLIALPTPPPLRR